jgi:hypothetical protein
LAGNVLGQDSPPNRLYTTAELHYNGNSFQLKALIDSGSDFSFLDKATAEHLNLQTTPIAPLEMETVDGTPLPTGSPDSIFTTNVTVDGQTTQLCLFLIKSPHAPIILGLDWLASANPNINWKNMALLPSKGTPIITNTFSTTEPESKDRLDNPAETT